MRVGILVLVAIVACADAISIGRPLPLASKLQAKKARLGDSLAGAAQQEELARLQVAAAERETSLADQFAMDLAAHVASKSAQKAESEAVAGMDTEIAADVSGAVQAEIVESLDADVQQAVDIAAETESQSQSQSQSQTGLSIENLQSLEYQQTMEVVSEAAAEAAAEAEAEKPTAKAGAKSAKAALTKSDAKKPAKLSVNGKGAKKTAAAVKKILVQSATKWDSCLENKSKMSGTSKLTAVAFRAAPPLRDMSFAVEIDGTYSGPDVTYGSVTVQIARVKTTEPQVAKYDIPELVYRHSVVLSDVIAFSPFKSTDPLSATLYVPEAAFNMYAASGDYIVTVLGINQDSQPFFCAKVDFKLA